METILPYLLNTILGAGGGWLGNMIKKNGLSMIANLLSGAVGGNLLPILASAVGLLGHPDARAAASAAVDIPSLITAVIGGGAGSLIGGLFKKPTA